MNSTRQIGIIDNRFLAKSVGTLTPAVPLTLVDNETVRAATSLLQQHSVGCVLLTDGSGILTGIFTERDVLRKVALDSTVLDKRVREFMTPSPQTAQMTTPVAFVLQMMSEGGFRHMPIVDESNYPVGILSVKDIVSSIVKTFEQDLQRL